MHPAIPTAPKFRRRALERPDELLDAALALFMQKGFTSTSVAEIARAAGLSKGAVYLYFPSKQAILEALVRRAVTPIGERALSLGASHADPREGLAAILRSVAGALSDPRIFAIPRIILSEAAASPEIAPMYRRAVFDVVFPAAVGLIRAGIASGHIRPVDPELTVRSLIGPLLIHLILAEFFGVVPEAGLDLERLIDNHLDILQHGLFAEPESPPHA